MLPYSTPDDHTYTVEAVDDRPGNPLKDLIEKIIEDRIRDGSTPDVSACQQVLECLKVLSPKSYGSTTLSDNSNAILGDVYQFYNSDSNGEQHRILHNLQAKVEELCRKQDDRDVYVAQLHGLLQKSNATVSNAESEYSKLMRDLLTLIAKSKNERSPEDVLLDCESTAVARRFLPDSCIDETSYMTELEEWASVRGSALLVIETEPLAASAMKATAVAVIQVLRRATLPIVWYLPDTDNPMPVAGTNTILQSLSCQLAGLGQDLTDSKLNRSTSKELHHHGSDTDLGKLFRFTLERVSHCFLIIELSLEFESHVDGEACARQLINAIAEVLQQVAPKGRVYKVLLIHSSDLATTGALCNVDLGLVRSCIVLSSPAPVCRARDLAIRREECVESIIGHAVLTT